MLLSIISCKCLYLLYSTHFAIRAFLFLLNFNYFNILITVFVHGYLEVFVYMYSVVCGCVFTCMWPWRGQRFNPGYGYSEAIYLAFWDRVSQWDLGLTHSARQVSPRASSICLSASSRCWNYKCGYHVCLFIWVLGTEVRSWCLHR